ncbi:AbiH family protein [uncultured Bacteroides sp.]|uniref:AbiH family protein n=1 Tax=uncultured Bacteroides sp. TaxID=162156 RepID=UPI00267528F3|nr:AbiH family protein [uncultured Bacteroides sp.]
MNRIIIIDNGFDIAHKLKTGYRDFIDDYWITVREKVYGRYWQLLDQQYGTSHSLRDYDDKFVNIKTCGKSDTEKEYFPYQEGSPLGDLCTLITRYNSSNTTIAAYLKFKNRFFERISRQCSLINWVDIENEYYNALKELLQERNPQKQSESIRTLNKEFDDIKGLLEEYLTKVTKNTKISIHRSIQEAFSSFVEFDEIATCKQTVFVDSIFSDMFHSGDDTDFQCDRENYLQYNLCMTEKEKQMLFIEKHIDKKSFKERYLIPSTLILNFNYTKTAEKLYASDNRNEIINIHGELDNENNPIIFGYGDELDDDYRKIEGLQNNDFLENIKSIKYHQTKNYRELLKFIALGPYQVFVMGHSCGNSDRTLLNTLFEHDNCLSIKVFYHQFEKRSDRRYSDNYADMIKNISRNFNNKLNMRDIVVNRESCSPLVPVKNK